MAMYALAVKPLIGELNSDAPGVKQVWYADDASGAGTCEDLRKWWDSLQVHGAGYGYYPNASKTHLVVKTEHAVRAKEMFADTDINILERLLAPDLIPKNMWQARWRNGQKRSKS